MTDSERLFNDFLKPYHTRLYTGDDPLVLQALELARKIKEAIRSLETTLPTMPDVYIGVCDDPELDASAFAHRGEGFIAINEGLIRVSLDLFTRLLSYPDVLSYIGNPSLESAPERWDLLVTDLGLLPAQLVAPSDPLRKQIAIILWTFFMEFMIAHEIAHHRSGHIRLDQELSGSGNLRDGMSIPSKKTGSFSAQMIELDADAFATNLGLQTLFARTKSALASSMPVIRLLFSNPSGVLRLWTFAICLFFRLTSGPVDFATIEQETHPPSRMRQRFFILTILTLMSADKVNYNPALFITETSDILQQIENAVATLTEMPAISLDLKKMLEDPEADRYQLRLLREWEILRPQLEPICYCTDLAAVMPLPSDDDIM